MSQPYFVLPDIDSFKITGQLFYSVFQYGFRRPYGLNFLLKNDRLARDYY